MPFQQNPAATSIWVSEMAMNVTAVIMTILTDTDCVLTLDVDVMSHVRETDSSGDVAALTSHVGWLFLYTG